MLKETRKLLERLAAVPLLLKQHKGLPSVVGIVTGEDLSYSWWSHPQSHLLFQVMNELADHADVLVCKLLFGKDTFVHRQLFPAVLALVEAEDGCHLDTTARQLLTHIVASERPVAAAGNAAKDLVLRLKVHALEVHTVSGRHELRLESWRRWAGRTGATPLKSAAAAQLALERAAALFGVTDLAGAFKHLKIMTMGTPVK